ncbi:MAG: TonB family protein [Halioglobus sp.]|nr:TonB family protein [Halioglobus sp.]
MGQSVHNRIGALCLLILLLAVASPGRAMDADLYLAGLGLHQETGRNIYLGGIYLDRSVPRTDDLTQSSGTRVMEYRVVARRTSMRSLLGGMLLQSEVATGRPPNTATADFADAILSTVSTSLYAGDSLRIESTDSAQTVARLNGLEVARSNDSGVANYLLQGWIGESGPSTVFRNHITAQELDPELLTTLEANTYTPERAAEIAALVGAAGPGNDSAAQALAQHTAPAQAEPATQDAEAPQAPVAAEEADARGAATQVVTIEAVAAEPVATLEPNRETAADSADAMAAVAATATTADALAAPDTLEPVTVQAQPLIDRSNAAPAAGPSPAGAETASEPDPFSQGSGIVQIAALLPTPDMLPANPVESEVAALGVQAYSQRLATFHTDLVRRVYSEIHYPKRAVRRSLEGRLELDVTLTAEGELVEVAVASPSGHQLLDEAAVAAAIEAFAKGRLQQVDPVAIAEFGDFSTGDLVIPIPVSFQLQ